MIRWRKQWSIFIILSFLGATSAYALNIPKIPIHDPKACFILLKKLKNRVEVKLYEKLFGKNKTIEFQKYQLAAAPVRDLEWIPKTSKFLQEHPVYLSVTTSPKRILEIHHVIETLDLTHVQKVFLSLPKKFGRTGESYVIPQELLENPKIEVIWSSVDSGPVMKMISAAEKLKIENPSAYLISFDDDTGYARGMVNELIYAASLEPGAVISGSGQNLNYWGIQNWNTLAQKNTPKKMEHGTLIPTDVVEGFGAIMYPVKKVPVDKIKAWSQVSRETFNSDDLVISMALESESIPKYAVESSYYSVGEVTQFRYGFESDALHQGAGLSDANANININADKYKKSYETLKKLH